MPASRKKNMKESIYITKAQLHDYVTKYEFIEFVGEMRDFKENTGQRLEGIDSRLNSIDRRLDGIDRRIDRLEDQFRIQTGAIIEEVRVRSKTTMEYLQHIESKITMPESK